MPLQWSIFRAVLDPIHGREQAGTRPVLVISAEPINENYDVVLTIPITSRKEGRTVRLGEVLLPAGAGGLPMDSIALCYQTRALDKSRLGRSYGRLEDRALQLSVIRAIAACADIHPDDLTEVQVEDQEP